MTVVRPTSLATFSSQGYANRHLVKSQIYYNSIHTKLIIAQRAPKQHRRILQNSDSSMMRYPDYYIGDMKENATVEGETAEELEYSDHLRLSAAHSHRNTIDENSAALKDSNHRYSEDSRYSDPRLSKGSGSRQSHRGSYRESRESSSDHRLSSKIGNARRQTNTSNTTSQSRSSKSQSRSSKTSSNSATEKTIALFGVNGVTGNYFLQLAVEAGYQVRALILPGFELEDMRENPNLTLIHGTLDDDAKIHRVIRKAAYVVCMLNDCPQPIESANTSNPAAAPPSNFAFIQKLVPLMSSCSACKVLLYQASSFASDTKGSTPMLTNVVKKMAVRKTRRETLQEQDRVVKYISKHLKACAASESGSFSPFQYIITRPSGMVWDRPSRKKLAASKSLPGPFPITNVDLAEFSLNALKMEKLYNTCPYVVQDGI